jgi:NADH-quinone oxidoreductase subunit L
MTVPLIVLAIGSAVAGGLMVTPVKDWLTPVFGSESTVEHEPVLNHTVITVLSIVLTLAGAALGWMLFRNGTALAPQPAGPVVTAARSNLYLDTLNEVLVEMPGKYLTRALVYFDNKVIDGLVNGLAATVGGGSGRLRRLQTGFVRTYALSMLGGALLVAIAFLIVRLA